MKAFLSLLVLILASTTFSVGKKKDPPAAPLTPLERSKIPPKGVVERTNGLRSHTIYGPYVDSDLQNRWFDFGGDTIVNTNKHIRLTQDRQSQQGWLWSRLPVSGQAFQIEFEFRVDGKGSALYGDGFAVWLTRQRAQTGPVFGSMDKWEGLGIFFDTYANSRHGYTFPLVMAMTNDGTKTYEVGKDGLGQEEGACSIDYRRAEVTAKARITYLKGQFLEVQIQHDKWDEWSHCFTLWDYNLIPGPFLGFSAHTGQISDAHDIISISSHNVVFLPEESGTDTTTTSRGRRRSRSSSGPNGSKSSGGFFGFLQWLLKWVLVFTLVVLAVIGYRAWSMNQKAKRNRHF